MKHETEDPKNRISALVDGQLGAHRLASVMAEMETTADMVSTWHVYQLIGDAMRSEDLANGAHDLEFLARLQEKLALEPVPAGPVPSFHRELAVATPSANMEVFRWKRLTGVAMTVLVSVVGVGLWSQLVPSQLQVAAVSNPLPVAMQYANPQPQLQPEAQVMLRDPQLDAFMAAHQQLGGYSALQMPSGFLRNATFERPYR